MTTIYFEEEVAATLGRMHRYPKQNYQPCRYHHHEVTAYPPTIAAASAGGCGISRLFETRHADVDSEEWKRQVMKRSSS